jgi:uncharacterized membrane protein (UPF0136 family)
MTTGQILLWVYIALLMAGGLMGFIKAGSKASLIASSVFALVLAIFALVPSAFPYYWIPMAVLLVFFVKRFAASKKVMPNGMMSIVTLLFLVLIHFV